MHPCSSGTLLLVCPVASPAHLGLHPIFIFTPSLPSIPNLIVVCRAARMWPYITEAGERQAKALLPGMLAENKPTWMTTLELHK